MPPRPVPSQAGPCSALPPLLSSIPGDSQAWLPAGPEQQVTVVREARVQNRQWVGAVSSEDWVSLSLTVSRVPNKSQATPKPAHTELSSSEARCCVLPHSTGSRSGLCTLHSGSKAREGSLQALSRDLWCLDFRVQF